MVLVLILFLDLHHQYADSPSLDLAKMCMTKTDYSYYPIIITLIVSYQEQERLDVGGLHLLTGSSVNSVGQPVVVVNLAFDRLHGQSHLHGVSLQKLGNFGNSHLVENVFASLLIFWQRRPSELPGGSAGKRRPEREPVCHFHCRHWFFQVFQCLFLNNLQSLNIRNLVGNMGFCLLLNTKQSF